MARVRSIVAALAIVVTALSGSSIPDGLSNGHVGVRVPHPTQVAGKRWAAPIRGRQIAGKRWAAPPRPSHLAVRLSGRYRTNRS